MLYTVLYLLSGLRNKKWLDKTGQCNWIFLFNIEEATNVYVALNLGRCIVLRTICCNTGCGVFKEERYKIRKVFGWKSTVVDFVNPCNREVSKSTKI